MKINSRIRPVDFARKLTRFWELSGEKVRRIEKEYNASRGAPVFTVRGKYTLRGWTEWTQGFQYGSAILQYDATREPEFLERARANTVHRMAPHVSHFGVHDHGLILHSVYHRPNGWDYIPPKRKVPCGESSMWGDYHAREAGLYVQRIAAGGPYLTFWGD